MSNSSLENALIQWRAALGEDAVILDWTGRAACTFSAPGEVLALLRPSSRVALAKCLSIACAHQIALYPLSSGRNWGYGSATPARPAVLLDLSCFNEILDYDAVLGTVTLQPGVTQQQLYDFLQKEGGKFWMDATGSSPQCSVLGNTLERGFGHSPYSDHAAQVVRVEVMLADGRLIQTGLGHFAQAKAANHYAAGLGPGLSSLFLQSNFGVVVSITINLMPTPEYFQAVYFAIDHAHGLPDLVDALQPLRLHEVIRSALHIGNGYRVLSSIQQYPWEDAAGKTPLPEPVLQDFARRWDFGAWNGSGALYGTRKQVAEDRRRIKAALHGHVSKLRFMDDAVLAFAKRVQKPYHWLTGVNLPEMLKLVEPVHHMMKGKPTDRILASTYWRKRMAIPPDMNPDRDGCGLIWCAHVAPSRGHHAHEMTEIAERILLAHGFEPGMTLTMINARCLDNVVSISYDRQIPGEDQRALACYAEVAQALMHAGYPPYRLGTQAMHLLEKYGGAEYVALLRQLKQLFDPQGVISPGRYIPL